MTRRWVPVLLISLQCGYSSLAQNWLPDSHIEVRNAVVPVYLDFTPEPAAIFRVHHIFSDYQTRGFFRIGVLPLLVLDGLNLEIRDPARLSAALNTTSEYFAVKANAKKAVEGRDFVLSFASDKNARVQARSVRLESGTEWRLQEGTIFPSGAAPLPFRKATLAIAGPQAGQLSFETTNGPVHLHLLSLTAQKQP